MLNIRAENEAVRKGFWNFSEDDMGDDNSTTVLGDQIVQQHQPNRGGDNSFLKTAALMLLGATPIGLGLAYGLPLIFDKEQEVRVEEKEAPKQTNRGMFDIELLPPD